MFVVSQLSHPSLLSICLGASSCKLQDELEDARNSEPGEIDIEHEEGWDSELADHIDEWMNSSC